MVETKVVGSKEHKYKPMAECKMLVLRGKVAKYM